LQVQNAASVIAALKSEMISHRHIDARFTSFEDLPFAEQLQVASVWRSCGNSDAFERASNGRPAIGAL
jgi:hypothetical protein